MTLRHDSSEPGVQSQWTWGSSIAKAVTLDKARATLHLPLGHLSLSREVEIPNPRHARVRVQIHLLFQCEQRTYVHRDCTS